MILAVGFIVIIFQSMSSIPRRHAAEEANVAEPLPPEVEVVRPNPVVAAAPPAAVVDEAPEVDSFTSFAEAVPLIEDSPSHGAVKQVQDTPAQPKPAPADYCGESNTEIANARTVLARGNLDAAKTAFERAVKTDPSRALAHCGLGDTCVAQALKSFQRLNQLAKAVQAIEDDRILKATDNTQWTQRYLAASKPYIEETLNYANLLKAAITAFKDAIRLEMDCSDAHLGLALAYTRIDNHYGAVDELEHVLRLRAKDIPTMSLLASEYIITSQTRKAVQLLQDAIEIAPHDAGVHLLLGEAYLKQGDKTAAIEEYKTLKDIDEKSAAVLFDKIYPDLGKPAN